VVAAVPRALAVVAVAAAIVRAPRLAAASTRWTTIFRSDGHLYRNVTKKPVTLVVTGFFLVYVGNSLSTS
jgi:hypothetical protein